jgi:hypothetical protein
MLDQVSRQLLSTLMSTDFRMRGTVTKLVADDLVVIIHRMLLPRDFVVIHIVDNIVKSAEKPLEVPAYNDRPLCQSV